MYSDIVLVEDMVLNAGSGAPATSVTSVPNIINDSDCCTLLCQNWLFVPNGRIGSDYSAKPVAIVPSLAHVVWSGLAV